MFQGSDNVHYLLRLNLILEFMKLVIETTEEIDVLLVVPCHFRLYSISLFPDHATLVSEPYQPKPAPKTRPAAPSTARPETLKLEK
jgi:hypothetical protein